MQNLKTKWLGLSLRFHTRWLAAAVLVVAVGCASPRVQRVNAPNPADPMDVSIYRLQNGLHVYLTQNPEKPRFYAEIAVRAGSKNDPDETTGLAHYLEHLMFKGNREFGTLSWEKEEPYIDRIVALYEEHYRAETDDERRAIYDRINAVSQEASAWAIPNELTNVYKSVGAQGLNAFTWVEQTVYLVDMPANRMPQWATVESSRFRKPVFRLFHTELETVYEEKNRSMDNKGRLIYEAVDEALFKNHPYGQHTTLGEAEHLKKPSIRNIMDFYDTWYVPNNMAICISGDIDKSEAVRVIDREFSAWEPRPLPERSEWPEEPLREREQVTVQYEGEEYVLLAFRLPSLKHPDSETLEVLDMVLSNSTAGLIDLNLNQQQRVRHASSHVRMYNDYGVHYLAAVPKKGQSLEEVEQLLLEQVKMVKAGDFEEGLLEAIINDFKKSEKRGLEHNSHRAGMMRDAFLQYQDWDHAVGRLDRMASITKQDVVEAAREYYGDGYIAGYRIDAPYEKQFIEKPKIDKVEIDRDRQSEFMKEVLTIPAEPIEPEFVEAGRDYQRADIEPGVHLYYVQEPINDLFSLSIRFDVGERHEPRLGMAAGLFGKSGTIDLSPEELKKAWYQLGTDFGFSAGANESSFHMGGLDENFEESLALAVEAIMRPAADKETLNLLVENTLSSRLDSKKDPSTLHRALMAYNLYGDKSPYLDRLPAERVRALTVDELHALTRSLPGHVHRIEYVGSLPLEEVREVLRRLWAFPAERRKAPPDYIALPMREPSQTEVYLYDKDTAQALVGIDIRDVHYDGAIHNVSELYGSYFGGGMGGIVFQELREARGLAYTAYGAYVHGARPADRNRGFGYIGTQPDKAVGALAAFIDLFDNLPESEERFGNTRDSLLNEYRTGKLGYREILGNVRTWEYRGFESDPRRQRFEELPQIGFNDMLQFHRGHIRSKPKMISIVGDCSRMDLKAIGDFGVVHEVETDMLFTD